MSFQFDLTSSVPVRPAATVMLVRDTPAHAIEVCMLQRNLDSDFVGGAYVFPGGGVDPDDGESEVGALCVGLNDEDASARLGLPRNGLAFWVAAVRETLEEAGLLLARRQDGAPLDLTDPDVAERFALHRRSVDTRERRLVEICAEEQLCLDLTDMHYVSHWVTPAGSPRRYDTRFFLAAAPTGQRAVSDDHEVISAQWVEPGAALEENVAGRFPMLPPTIANLRYLQGFASVDAALRDAAVRMDVPAMVPRVIDDPNGIRIVLPGDPDYDKGYAGDHQLSSWPGLTDRVGPKWADGRPVGTTEVGMPDIDGTGRASRP